MATFNGTYTSTDGKYSVAIEENGKIEVKKGDWLSKYSAALYGDPHKVENVYGSLVNRELVVINIVDELTPPEAPSAA